MENEIKEFVLSNLQIPLADIYCDGDSNNQYSLDKYQHAIIYGYSMGLGLSLNASLVSGANESYYLLYQKYLNYVLEKLPVYKGLVYRKVSLSKTLVKKYQNAFKQNNLVQECFFTSTSKFRRVIARMEGNVEFKILSKAGRSIELYSAFGVDSVNNEHEVTFKTGTLFSVSKVTEYIKNTYLIEMQEV